MIGKLRMTMIDNLIAPTLLMKIMIANLKMTIMIANLRMAIMIANLRVPIVTICQFHVAMFQSIQHVTGRHTGKPKKKRKI